MPHPTPSPKKERGKRGRGKSLREKEENGTKSHFYQIFVICAISGWGAKKVPGKTLEIKT